VIGDRRIREAWDVVENVQDTSPQVKQKPEKYVPYDKRKLSYATTFTDPKKIITIRAMEWMTGKITLLRRIREFERAGVRDGLPFFEDAVRQMGIDLQVTDEQIDNIPATGPLIVVANHPHGMTDGLVMADLIGRKRDDFLVLTRSLISGVQEIKKFMLPVPFPHEEDSFNESLKMRKTAMDRLKDGGCIILFPAGEVAHSKTWFGPAIESDWNPFTAKMIQRSGAQVLPIFFPGQNTRLYQMANLVSPTLRQGLLLHEVVHTLDKPQAPKIGKALTQDDMKPHMDNTREFMAWLRQHTMDLANS
jgi:putative hemolysin